MRKRPSITRSNPRAEFRACALQPDRDPVGVLVPRQARVAELQFQPYQLQLLDSGARPPDSEHPEIVAQHRIDAVIIDSVAEVEEHRPAVVPFDPMEQVGRVAGDEARACILESGGGPVLPGSRRGTHVWAPVGEEDRQLASVAHPRHLVQQPVRNPALEIGVGDPVRPVARRVLPRVIRDAHESHFPPVCLDHHGTPRCVSAAAGTRGVDTRARQ